MSQKQTICLFRHVTRLDHRYVSRPALHCVGLPNLWNQGFLFENRGNRRAFGDSIKSWWWWWWWCMWVSQHVIFLRFLSLSFYTETSVAFWHLQREGGISLQRRLLADQDRNEISTLYVRIYVLVCILKKKQFSGQNLLHVFFFSGRETQATDKISIKIMLLPRWLKVFFTNLKASASAESKSDGFLHHVGIWDEWIHREFKQTHMNSPCELGIFMVFR